MDTRIITGCRHGEGCTRTICRVLAQMAVEKAQGVEARPLKVQDRNWDATFPGHIRRRHNLRRGKAA